jgi:hypothetical protein
MTSGYSSGLEVIEEAFPFSGSSPSLFLFWIYLDDIIWSHYFLTECAF